MIHGHHWNASALRPGIGASAVGVLLAGVRRLVE